MDRTLTWNYGGGTQSTAILILIAQGRLPKPDVVIMADTGREKAETWRYLEQYARPLMQELGLTLHIAGHDLATVDLYSKKEKTLLIPAWTKTGRFSNFCSGEWKVEVVRRYLRSLGYGPKRPVLTWLGISVDELGRLKESDLQWQKLQWPLIFLERLTRDDCIKLVERFGWPSPPRSACWLCSHMGNAEWQHMKINDPDDFARAVATEAEIWATDDEIWLHKSRVPLAEANLSVPDKPPLPLFGAMGEGCDKGYCMN